MNMSAAPQKTFYLETFGCQMNVHDSEKVIGTLVHEGYQQVQTVEQADLILYNTCSIRDKAEQKVFNRLNDYKKLLKQGKKFGVLGWVAQQEGEKIFERAPHVSLVCGSASYRNLPQMLTQLEAGSRKPEARTRTPKTEARKPKPEAWTASPDSTIAKPTNASKPNSPRAPIPIADTSPSSKAATNSAPSASFRLRAVKNAAA